MNPATQYVAPRDTENRDLLALRDETEEPGEHQASSLYEKEWSAREWKHLRKSLEEEYAAACKGGRKDRIARLLLRLGREMDLAPEDIALIELRLHGETQPIFGSLIECFERGRHYQRLFNVAHPVLPCILGVPASAFCARFAADAPLMKSGLVSVDDYGDIKIVRRLLRLVSVPDASELDVCSLLLDPATPGELEWSDFDHVAEERDHIEKMIIAEGSILVFDEADSLLADRQGAVRSWEIIQVNEMLTWMESHPLPFACTTNFGDNLDPAALRRFTFKIALDYLTPDQSQAAFRTYFVLNPPPELGDLTILTPGDFAVVRRKAEILGHLQDAKALAELLHAECEAKPNHSRKMGF